MMLIVMEENVNYSRMSANVTQPILQLQQNLHQQLQQKSNVRKENSALPMRIAMEENVYHVIGIGNVANVTQPIIQLQQ